jgi:protein-histidine pros-kinase
VESAPDALVIVDSQGLVVVVNAQAERLFGYQRAELISAPIEKLIPKRLANAHLDHRSEFIDDPHTRAMGVGLELFALRKDGSEVPVEISLSPLQTSVGTLVVAAVRDVTERKRSEQLFRGLLESAPDAVVIVDANGRIALLNAQSEKLFGYAREELIGLPVERLVPGRFSGVHIGHRSQFVDDPSPREMGADINLFAIKKDGTEFPVEISLSPLFTESGMLVSAAVRDVTDRRRVSQEAEEAKQEAERANRAKSDFLSRMSHELRTPLNAILGFGQLLEMERLSSSQDESLHQIMGAGRHLLDLIDEVLDISRIEAGRLPVSSEPVPVDVAISDAIQLVVPIARERGIVFEERGSCLGVFVMADRQRIRQVLLNLLSNAVKYNRPGGTVVVDCLEVSEARLRISVSDNGPGIAEDLLERIFLPFDRLGVGDEEVQGTGLGLALSKGLVEAMGGTMNVESVVGEGTAFAFELPLAVAPDAGLEDLLDESLGKALGTDRTVLYVEDNLSNLKLVERVLELRPHVRLISAMQGILGLDLAQTHLPDLILLDLHLPDVHGEEVLARLRSDPATSGIPVVIVSADATPSQVQRLIASGAAAYLTKPLNVSEFLEVLDEILSPDD